MGRLLSNKCHDIVVQSDSNVRCHGDDTTLRVRYLVYWRATVSGRGAWQ